MQTKISSHHPTPVARHPGLWLTIFFTLMMACALAVAADESAKPGNEGIKVHGEWELIVTDPSGAVVNRVHFSNALNQAGQELLVLLLTGQGYVSLDPSDSSLIWDLVVRATGLVDSVECNELSGNTLLGASTALGPTPPTRASLTYDRYSFQLSRDLKMPVNCVVGSDYTITQVLSNYAFTGDPGPSANRIGTFTSKALDTPLVVLPGQVVTMVVTFSFS